MKSQSTFACCRFNAASSRLALPVEYVAWVHDNESDDDNELSETHLDAPHICDILDIESRDQERRVLRLQTGDGAPLFLSVDLPIGVEDFEVEAVLPRSAALTDEYTEAIVESNGEMVLVLNGKKISQALRALRVNSDTEATE